MGTQIDILETSKLIAQAWQKAANHKKLSFEETNALRAAMVVFDRIEQAGESLVEFLGNGDNDTAE